MFYSKTNNGFYDSKINKVIPEDAVEITEEKYIELLNGQSEGFRITSDEFGFPVLKEQEVFVPTSEQNKQIATLALKETDWVNQPDVYDSNLTPHLLNRDAFILYRSKIRNIAVNPTDGILDWPTEPIAVWSDQP